MVLEGIVRVLESVPGGSYTVLSTAIVGLVVIVSCTVCRGRSSSSGDKPVTGGCNEGEEDDENTPKQRKQQPKNRPKQRQQSSKTKVALPPHPLLATEFKGHTGAVLSLDFDSSGKYLASCSEG